MAALPPVGTQEDLLLVNLAVAVLAAAGGGLVANLLRQPLILGYLLAGALIGPFAFGFVSEVAEVRAVANVGLVFLLFALGVEFSIADVRALGARIILASLLGIGTLLVAGSGIALAFGLAPVSAVFVGAVVSISSTLVGLKLLLDRGELDALHGKLTIAVLIVQDLALVPILILLQALTGGTEGLAQQVLVALLTAAVVAVGVLLLGTRLIPEVLYRVALSRSTELTILTAVALALGAAFLSEEIGLGLAFGAFVAGLLVSESDYSKQILGQVVPLRDTFGALFFVSLGMLTDFRFVIENVSSIIAVSAALIGGKVLVNFTVLRALGFKGFIPIAVALLTAQIGEFSFILVKVGLDEGVLSDFTYSLLLASAIVSILLTAPLYRLARPAHARLRALWPAMFSSGGGGADVAELDAGLRNHAIICGYGRVGRLLCRALAGRRLSYVVVDLDPRVIREVRAAGISCVFGDATNPVVLERAGVERARVFVVTVPDPVVAESAVGLARTLQPRLDIVARSHRGSQIDRLRELGAREVVEPEFEAGLEIIRHTLLRFGVDGREVQFLLNTLRSERTGRQSDG